MILEMDDTIINRLKTRDDVNDMVLINIANIVKEGWHIVYASRELLDKIISNEQLPPYVRRIYMSLKNKQYQIRSFKKKITGYVVVNADNDKITHKDVDEKRVYYVPFEKLQKASFLQRLQVITENTSDSQLYISIAKKYIKEKKLGCCLDIKSIAGGGDQTGVVYENLIQQEDNICLAVVDSDKKYRKAKIGVTAKKVQDVYLNNNATHVTDLHILNVREKENLIPTCLYRLCSDSIHFKKELELLECLEYNPKLKDFYLYGDIKDGIKLDELLGISNNVKIFSEYLLNQVIKSNENKECDKCFLIYFNEVYQEIIRYEEFNVLISQITNYDGSIVYKEAEKVVDEMITKWEKYSTSKKNNAEKTKSAETKNNKEVVIEGVGTLIHSFKKEILEEELVQIIEHKEKAYSKVPNQALLEHIKFLKKNYEESTRLFALIPEDVQKEWEMIAITIITWGCGYKLLVA